MKKILLITVALAAGTALFAQTPLPNDPAVKVGKLDNGLTYYIRHNDKPAQRAEFYLATNVGAIQETPDQDGLAHFLEHMCFNGLKNLPGKMMLEYLQRIGAEFGRNINASTGVESTQYMLNNIPVIREGIIDTCLLVMHDYSHFVLCDPVEIDAERGVILEERRTRRNADWRLYEKSMPYYYGDTKYAECSVIGSEENLKTFKPESLVNFYQTWYRPDNQALIVVGDIDVDQIEDKIKDLFADIPAPVDPKAKDYIKIPDNAEPMIGIIGDPEASSSSITVLWRSERMPESLNNTDLAFVTDFAEDVISYAMSERFQDITTKPDAPFFNASFGVGKLVESCEAAMGDIMCKDEELASAFKAYFTEIEKMKRFGFTDGEIQRAKDNVISNYEKAAAAADSRKNAEFIRPLIRNFFDNEAYLTPETALQIAQQVSGMLPTSAINQIATALITDENLAVVLSGPEKDGLAKPTEEEIMNIIKEVRAAEMEAPAAEEELGELLDPASLKGSKVKKATTGIYNSIVWTLKNKVKVIVLPTEYKKDQVLVRLIKQGGTSLLSDEELYSFEDNVWSLFQSNSGLAGFSGSELPKMLSGKNVSVNANITKLEHGIWASSTPKDLETALQCLYLQFVQPRFDENEYNIGLNQLKSMLPSLLGNPMMRLQQRIPETLYDSPRRFAISEEVLAKADVKTAEKAYRKLFNDAAGAVVYIVGNVNPDELKPLVEKYIGSLPKGKKATEIIDHKDYVVKGAVEDCFTVPMQTPKTSVLNVYTADIPYTVANEVALDGVKYVLDMIYTATLREEEGGTYGASAASSFMERPKSMALLQVYFDTNTEMAPRLRELAREGLKRIAEEGPTEEEFTRTIENFKKNVPEQRLSNPYWLGSLSDKELFGRDYDTEYEAAVNSLTANDIKSMAKAILEQGNLIEMVMNPE